MYGYLKMLHIMFSRFLCFAVLEDIVMVFICMGTMISASLGVSAYGITIPNNELTREGIRSHPSAWKM
jgi:hypothetical protein